MPAIIQAFFLALSSLLPYLVAQVVIALGFGATVFVMGTWTIESVFVRMAADIDGLPTEILAVLHYGNFGEAVSIVFGTYAAVFVFLGMRNGQVQKLSFKGLSQ